MKTITKGPEPASLTVHRQTPHCDYENYAGKSELRAALVLEQQGICCYCMCRIHNDPTTMKIEHWQCQANHESERLNYRNLLGSCLGGEGQPSRLQHCDTSKGDRDLKWNPADLSHRIESRIHYELDGTIGANDPAFKEQLDKVLNLNLELLKNNRKYVLTGILEWWSYEKGRLRGPVPQDLFERKRDQWAAENGDLNPYCQVVVWWLEQRLKRMRA